jgi:hypothetical protein
MFTQRSLTGGKQMSSDSPLLALKNARTVAVDEGIVGWLKRREHRWRAEQISMPSKVFFALLSIVSFASGSTAASRYQFANSIAESKAKHKQCNREWQQQF